MRSIKQILFGISIVLGLLAAACTAPAGNVEPTPLPVEVVASGMPMAGSGTQDWIAILDAQSREISDQLPEEAQEKLKELLADPGDYQYLVIYPGPQPSGGYQVELVSTSLRSEAGQERLVVAYQVKGPAPDEGAAAVITHPYLILKVPVSAVPEGGIIFEKVVP